MPPPLGIVFLAVPDQAVGEVAAAIARLKPPSRLNFVHVSGALGLGALDALRDHPVGSLRRLRALARAIGARPRHVDDSQRALYHAAAVFASNYVDAVLGDAVNVLRAAGWTENEAISGLLPLTEGTLANVRKRGPVRALTGPIRRGDVETVKRHLEALDGLDRAAEYRMLGLIALEIAVEAGLEPAAAGRMRRALTEKSAATRRRRRE